MNFSQKGCFYKGQMIQQSNRKNEDIFQIYEKMFRLTQKCKLSNTEIQFSSYWQNIKKYDDLFCGLWETGILTHYWWKYKLQRELGNNLTKLHKEFDPATPLLGIHPADTLLTI